MAPHRIGRASWTGAVLASTVALAVSCGGAQPAATAPPAPAPGLAASDHGHANDQEDVAASPSRLRDLFRFYSSDYEPAATFASLSQRSTVVLLARLVEIREGRVTGASRDDPARIEHLVHVFTVSRVLRGNYPSDTAYVETVKPGRQPAAVYDAARPAGGDAVLYLVPRPGSAGPPDINPRAGLGPDATPMWATTPQGYLLLDGDTVIHPLDAAVPSPALFAQERPDVHDLRSWLPPELRITAG